VEETSSKDSSFGDALIEPEQALGNLVKKIRQEYPECSGYVCVGDPADKIVMMAEILRADLILTGSRQPNFLGRLLGFDEPSRIVHRALCPVLVYHDANWLGFVTAGAALNSRPIPRERRSTYLRTLQASFA
jgi:nucleotide-binding universal stress UspA family protein